jgi:luciferase family oxidoreductase group 1
MPAFSVLDLAPVAEGATPADALHRSLDLARHVEQWGYRRFWVAEHHNMVGIASAATAVVIGYIAGGTKTIRVGSGGIMLPNHSPIVIAEQFGTLESLYPGRIDLGLGRAPGTDQRTLRALRRDPAAADSFPQDVLELQALLGPLQPGQVVQAVPGTGLNVPLWILGSSLFGAQLAAMLGLPYGFASHFAPDALMDALAIYRERFEPSAQLDKPYAMVGANVFAAETDAEARRLFTSTQQRVTDMFRGTRGLLPPPIDDIESYWTPAEKAQVQRMLACSFVGSPETVRQGLERFIAQTGADEIMVSAMIYDHQARMKSYEILADVAKTLQTKAPASEQGPGAAAARTVA